jgi:hypothetical protein
MFVSIDFGIIRPTEQLFLGSKFIFKVKVNWSQSFLPFDLVFSVVEVSVHHNPYSLINYQMVLRTSFVNKPMCHVLLVIRFNLHADPQMAARPVILDPELSVECERGPVRIAQRVSIQLGNDPQGPEKRASTQL